MEGQFIEKYFSGFSETVKNFFADPENKLRLLEGIRILQDAKAHGKKVILVGNGGSAAIAEHMAIDLTKSARIPAVAISGSPTMTALANDYGYESVFQKGVQFYGNEDDVLVAISSGGISRNILGSCEEARKKKLKIITFSGFDGGNPLRKMGDVNFWVNSKSYGFVEIFHNLLIHCMNDMMVGKIEDNAT